MMLVGIYVGESNHSRASLVARNGFCNHPQCYPPEHITYICIHLPPGKKKRKKAQKVARRTKNTEKHKASRRPPLGRARTDRSGGCGPGLLQGSPVPQTRPGGPDEAIRPLAGGQRRLTGHGVAMSNVCGPTTGWFLLGVRLMEPYEK